MKNGTQKTRTRCTLYSKLLNAIGAFNKYFHSYIKNENVITIQIIDKIKNRG